MLKNKSGYSLLETLVVVLLIVIIASLATVLLFKVKAKTNDTKRKAELSQIGKFLTVSCYLPDAGVGTYDLLDLLNELMAKDEKYRQLNLSVWRDPKSGTADKSGYNYSVTADNKCVLYVNLENEGEEVTLPALSAPTPGGGSGVLAAPDQGPNGSHKYFQVSN